MVNIIKGNLIELALDSKFDVIAHGCNCQGIMVAGIAGQIVKEFPLMKQMDSRYSKDSISKMNMLGTNLICPYYETKIVNCYTQFHPGANFNIAAFEMCMLKLRDIIGFSSRIGIPKIGCGIGGGDWDEVLKVLEKIFDKRDIIVVIYKN